MARLRRLAFVTVMFNAAVFGVCAIGSGTAMASMADICKRLAAATDATGEAAVLAEWSRLPPPQRSVRYTVRRAGDARTLKADEIPNGAVEGLEVTLHCASAAGETDVLWRPKSAASLVHLMRE